MRPGKEHARALQPAVPDNEPAASSSRPAIRDDAAQQVISGSSETQPSNPDGHTRLGDPSTPGTPTGTVIWPNRKVNSWLTGVMEC